MSKARLVSTAVIVEKRPVVELARRYGVARLRLRRRVRLRRHISKLRPARYRPTRSRTLSTSSQ
jgi:hypothetical protein